MESTKQKLIDYMNISARVDIKAPINPIDQFLLDYEPASVEDAEKFRKQLLEAINYENEEEKTIRNANIIDSFIAHCKLQGIDIPNTVFESFFGA